jgi:hypothetical protein
MGVKRAGGFLFIVKTANPSLSRSCDLDKLLLNGSKFSAEGRKRQLPFSDGYPVFVPYMSGKEDFFIFPVQGWATLPATSPASYATGYIYRS